MSGSGGWPGSCRKLRRSVVEWVLAAVPPEVAADPDVAAAAPPEVAAAAPADVAAALDAAGVLEPPPQAEAVKAIASGMASAVTDRLRVRDVRMFLLIEVSVGSGGGSRAQAV